jgi:hypothetical protein
MNPRKALEQCKEVLNILNNDLLPFKVRTESDCGLHVNISHPDITKNNVSQLVIPFLVDEKVLAKRYGRDKCNYCLPMKDVIYQIVQNLVESNIISLSGFETKTGIDTTLKFIEARIIPSKNTFSFFGNINDYGYLEYRYIGGKNYQKKYTRIKRDIEELLILHKKHINWKNEKVIENQLRLMLLNAEAYKNDGKSIVDIILQNSSFKNFAKKTS